MRVLVCGGRDYHNSNHVNDALSEIRPSVVIEGGARGADFLAADWARANLGVDALITFRADWERNGKAAGPIRNQKMLDEGKPDLVVAFPGGRGTADMISRAIRAGIAVRLATDPQHHTGE